MIVYLIFEHERIGVYVERRRGYLGRLCSFLNRLQVTSIVCPPEETRLKLSTRGRRIQALSYLSASAV